MRETSFIKQNKEKWKEFEQILDRKDDIDPEKLKNLFVQITDDLSYSRTFYPFRSVRVYLNHLAQQVFNNLTKVKRSPFERFKLFWTDELPQLIFQAKPELRLSFLVFLAAFLIGVLSSFMDPDFPRVILGDRYVDMTIENIESGDPMAVYKDSGMFDMSLGITLNNLSVALLAFVMGVFFSIGTITILLFNGVMVGAFQFFFYQKGVFLESFLTIWTHGTLEISAIIIAGAAGLTMGKGLVFPGTLSRKKSFQVSARRGLKIMIGIAPIIILAGFIEGYLTRFTETPDIISFLFILACLAFILFYYVYYPAKLSKEGFKTVLNERRLAPKEIQQINHHKIKNSGEIFSEIFIVYKKHFGWISLTAVFGGLFYCLSTFPFNDYQPSAIFSFKDEQYGALNATPQLFLNENIFALSIINILVYSIIAFLIFHLFTKQTEKFQPVDIGNRSYYPLLNFIYTLLVTTVLYFFLTKLPIFLVLILCPIVFTISYLCLFITFKERINLFSAISRAFYLGGGNIGHLHSLFLLLTFIGACFFLILDTTLMNFYIELISWVVNSDQGALDELLIIVLTFTFVTTLGYLLPILLIGIGLLYSSLIEIKEAFGLKEKIRSIGIGKKIQGMEREVVQT